MNYLHILPSDTIRTYRVIEMMQERFDLRDHKFLIMADREYVTKNYPVLLGLPGLIFLDKPAKRTFRKRLAVVRAVEKQMKKADVVVWHSLSSLRGAFGFPLLLICAKKKNLKKSVWIEHSTDLLYWRNDSAKNFKEKLENRLQKYVRDNILCVGLTLPSDKPLHGSSFSGYYKYFDLPTPPSESHVQALTNVIEERRAQEEEKRGVLIEEAVKEELERIRAIAEEEERFREEELKKSRRMSIKRSAGSRAVKRDKSGEIYLEFPGVDIFSAKEEGPICAADEVRDDRETAACEKDIETHTAEGGSFGEYRNEREDGTDITRDKSGLIYIKLPLAEKVPVCDERPAFSTDMDAGEKREGKEAASSCEGLPWYAAGPDSSCEADTPEKEEVSSTFENLPWFEKIVKQAKKAKANKRVEDAVKQAEAEAEAEMLTKEKAEERRVEQYASYEDLVEQVSAATKLPPHKPVILVGYDGLTYNGHKSLINSLSLLKGHRSEIEEVYVPMHYTMTNEYGSPSSDAYRKSISDYGVKVFGFRPKLLNNGNVDEDTYFRFLDKVDIAVFGGHRPLNPDLLLYLARMRKKIFLPKGTFLYKFLSDNGYPVTARDDISKMSFDDFIAPLPDEDKDFDWAKAMLDYNAVANKWQDFYNYMESGRAFEPLKKQRIKYLYLFFGTPHTLGGYWKMVDARKDAADHKYLIMREKSILKYVPELAERDDILYLCEGGRLKKARYLYRLFSNADNIIIHGMFIGTLPVAILALCRKFHKKLAWIEWSGDIWLWKREEESFKDKIINKLNRRIREVIPYIVMTAPTDEERFKSEFKTDAKCVYIALPTRRNGDSNDAIDAVRPPDKPADSPVRIQIGHNMFQFNNHLKILGSLKKFADRDVEIFIPMAYGDSGLNGQYGGWEYVNAVKRKAAQIFAGKLDLLTHVIPLDEYTAKLWHVDIAIFGSERICGAANIYMLIYMGKKVYLPGDSEYYKFFINKGIQVFDTNAISEMTYEDFIRPVENQNRSWILDQYNQTLIRSQWDRFFKELDERHLKK